MAWKAGNWPQHRSAGRASWRRASVQVALPPLIAILATVLTTLVCILHCHLLLAVSLAPTPPASTTVAGTTIFICHSPQEATDSAPAPINPALLRALHEGAPTPLVGLLLAPLLVARLRSSPPRPHAAPRAAPEPPPPRLAHS
jgi:hypothetical protein